MQITITTDGGFTGRGIGSIDVDDASSAALARAVASARPEQWQRDYPVSIGADMVRYTLTMGDTIVSWEEGAEIPEDLRAVFDAAWKR